MSSLPLTRSSPSGDQRMVFTQPLWPFNTDVTSNRSTQERFLWKQHLKPLACTWRSCNNANMFAAWTPISMASSNVSNDSNDNFNLLRALGQHNSRVLKLFPMFSRIKTGVTWDTQSCRPVPACCCCGCSGAACVSLLSSQISPISPEFLETCYKFGNTVQTVRPH